MAIGTDLEVRSGDLFRLLAWFSPSYPIGAFSYSHGIEYAVEAGAVKTAADLAGWIGHILQHGSGWIDAVLLKEAYAAWPDAARLEEIADLAAAWRGTAETALESAQQGGSFLAITRLAWGHPALDDFAARRDEQAVGLCVAVGLAAAVHRLPLPAVLAAYLHSVAANLVSAGVRLVPLGQTDGQRALAQLQPIVNASAQRAPATPLEDLGSAASAVDWCSMRHETQYTRLYRS